MRFPTTLCALTLALASLLSGCKQGEGDFCQVNADCEAPLQCTPGTQRCQQPGTSEVADAAAPPEPALPPDAGVPDAAPEPDASATD